MGFESPQVRESSRLPELGTDDERDTEAYPESIALDLFAEFDPLPEADASCL